MSRTVDIIRIFNDRKMRTILPESEIEEVLHSIDRLMWNEEEVLDEIERSNPLALGMTQDVCKLDVWLDRYEHLTNRMKKKLPLLIHYWHHNNRDILSKYDPFFVDLGRLIAQHVVDKGIQQQVNPVWRSDSSRFLFLTGKPDRINRIRLLWKFQQAGLMDKMEYSLLTDHKKAVERARQFLPELSDQEFIDFITRYSRAPDDIQDHNPDGYSSVFNWGIPYDHTLYSDSLFQVIAETEHWALNDDPVVSERLWYSVQNKMPFIVAGYPGYLNELDTLGIKTFREYLKVPYDDVQDWEERLDAVITNTIYWLAHLTEFEADVRRDIEHNYQRFLELHEDEKKRLRDKFGVEYTELVPLLTNHDWLDTYNDIKDPAWPVITDREGFFKLSEEIQRECRENFNCYPD